MIEAARMIDGTGAPAKTNVLLAVENGRIVDLRDASEEGAAVRLRPDITLLPGLIDSHVHLTIGHSPWSVDRYLATSSDQQLLYAAENGRRALNGGVTTVRDCGGKTGVLLALRDAIEAGSVEGPRLLLSGSPITTTAGHMWYFGIEADGEHEVRKAVRKALRDGVDFIKVAASGGAMTAHSNAREPQYSVAELRAIAEETRRLGTYATAHCHATSSIAGVLDAGFTMLEHAGFLASAETAGPDFHVENSYAYDPALAQRIADEGVRVGQFIFAAHRNWHFGTMEHYPRGLVQVLDKEMPRRVEILRDLRARGVSFVAGSDGWLSIASDLVGSIEVAVADVGLSCMEAIVHATSEAADAIGVGQETGSIQVGKSADLIAVEGDPLADITALRKVVWVMSRGRTIRALQ